MISVCKKKWGDYHPVLEAKLILPFGMALSLDIFENTDPLASKQDCELKAIGFWPNQNSLN